MPYMWLPPTLLALPLEIRHNIYSHLLIDNDVIRYHETLIRTRSIFLTCRQIYHEAFDYFYAKNTFSLSLITPHYSVMEIATTSDYLQRRLKHVQSLIVVIETCEEQRHSASTDGSFPFDTRYPKQQLQWTAFIHLLLDAKGKQDWRVLKDFTIEDWGLERRLSETALEDVEKDMAGYSVLLTPLKARVSRIKVVQGPSI